MKTQRVIGAVSAAALALMTLTSCTPGVDYGVRLNADGTIDLALCEKYGSYEVVVDYMVDGSDSGTPEWVMRRPWGEYSGQVIALYGDAPTPYETSTLRPPPSDWVSVVFDGHEADRNDLTVGEWLWSTSTYPWEPDYPCVSDEALDAAT